MVDEINGLYFQLRDSFASPFVLTLLLHIQKLTWVSFTAYWAGLVYDLLRGRIVPSGHVACALKRITFLWQKWYQIHDSIVTWTLAHDNFFAFKLLHAIKWDITPDLKKLQLLTSIAKNVYVLSNSKNVPFGVFINPLFSILMSPMHCTISHQILSVTEWCRQRRSKPVSTGNPARASYKTPWRKAVSFWSCALAW